MQSLQLRPSPVLLTPIMFLSPNPSVRQVERVRAQPGVPWGLQRLGEEQLGGCISAITLYPSAPYPACVTLGDLPS